MPSVAEISRAIRRNHTLEHASPHLLAREGLCARLMGHSDGGGSTLCGEIETAQTQRLCRLLRHRVEIAPGG